MFPKSKVPREYSFKVHSRYGMMKHASAACLYGISGVAYKTAVLARTVQGAGYGQLISHYGLDVVVGGPTPSRFRSLVVVGVVG